MAESNCTCKVDGCTNPARKTGLCNTHYMNARADKQPVRYCYGCHVGFKRALNGGTDSGRYCTKQCAYIHRKNVAAQVAGIKRLYKANRDKNNIERVLTREAACIAVLHDRVNRTCIDCSNPFMQTMQFGRNRARCDKCTALASDAFRKKNKRIAKAIRRARIRGAVYESIDPIKVFERDGWRCHICNKLTNKIKRGTYDDRAPELDHVISLAQGGSHTWGNVACACRRCNQVKGAKSLGQLSLAIAC